MHGSTYKMVLSRQQNGNPDEVELERRTEEKVKKWRTPEKVEKYGAHNTRSRTLQLMYLT